MFCIFSKYVAYPFIAQTVSFAEKKNFILMESY